MLSFISLSFTIHLSQNPPNSRKISCISLRFAIIREAVTGMLNSRVFRCSEKKKMAVLKVEEKSCCLRLLISWVNMAIFMILSSLI